MPGHYVWYDADTGLVTEGASLVTLSEGEGVPVEVPHVQRPVDPVTYLAVEEEHFRASGTVVAEPLVPYVLKGAVDPVTYLAVEEEHFRPSGTVVAEPLVPFFIEPVSVVLENGTKDKKPLKLNADWTMVNMPLEESNWAGKTKDLFYRFKDYVPPGITKMVDVLKPLAVLTLPTELRPKGKVEEKAKPREEEKAKEKVKEEDKKLGINGAELQTQTSAPAVSPVKTAGVDTNMLMMMMMFGGGGKGLSSMLPLMLMSGGLGGAGGGMNPLMLMLMMGGMGGKTAGNGSGGMQSMLMGSILGVDPMVSLLLGGGFKGR